MMTMKMSIKMTREWDLQELKFWKTVTKGRKGNEREWNKKDRKWTTIKWSEWTIKGSKSNLNGTEEAKDNEVK